MNNEIENDAEPTCQVYIARRKDGDEVDQVAAKYLRLCEFVYSEKRRAYLACANGLPWSFAAFVPMHGLEIVEEAIPRTERSELGLYVPLAILEQEQRGFAEWINAISQEQLPEPSGETTTVRPIHDKR